MVMTSEQYYQYLSVIQNTNPPTIAVIPDREILYNINLNTRQVDSPEFLSVEKD